MAGRIPPTGFYAHRPTSSSLLRSYGASSQPPPPPPPPPPSVAQGTSPGFAYSYSYNSSLTTGSHTISTNKETNDIFSSGGHSLIPKQATCWVCDACEISFDSERALKSHKKSHVKCTECSFEGVPKAVKAHYQARHGKFSGSGFKTITVAIPGCRVQRFRICVGNSPEDIQKWIAGRKKRFPRQQRPKTLDETANIEDQQGDSGLASLLTGYGSSSDDESVNKKEKEEGKIVTPASSIITKPITKIEKSALVRNDRSPNSGISQANKSRPCRYFMRNGSCTNGDACKFSHDVSNTQFPDNERKRKRSQSSSKGTLLRKLLSNDVERESSLAIQLMGYIVDCDFFEWNTTPQNKK